MKKIMNDVFVYVLTMLVFIASLVVVIIYGPSYPQMVFGAIMMVFTVVVALYVATTVKDVILLIGLMALLGGTAELVGNSFDRVLECVFMALVVGLLAKHVINMLKKKLARPK